MVTFVVPEYLKLLRGAYCIPEASWRRLAATGGGCDGEVAGSAPKLKLPGLRVHPSGKQPIEAVEW